MNSKWCISKTGAGHTCRRPATVNDRCWQHTNAKEKFIPWQCGVCGEILSNLPHMATKPITEAQEAYIRSLLTNRMVNTEEAAAAELWLAAAKGTKMGRDIACVMIHELLHKEKRSSYRSSYLN
jgi:hypothetical protein